MDKHPTKSDMVTNPYPPPAVADAAQEDEPAVVPGPLAAIVGTIGVMVLVYGLQLAIYVALVSLRLVKREGDVIDLAIDAAGICIAGFGMLGCACFVMHRRPSQSSEGSNDASAAMDNESSEGVGGLKSLGQDGSDRS